MPDRHRSHGPDWSLNLSLSLRTCSVELLKGWILMLYVLSPRVHPAVVGPWKWQGQHTTALATVRWFNLIFFLSASAMPQCRPLVFSQATFLHILNEFSAKHQPLWSRGCFDPQPQRRILHSWMLCYDLMPVQTSFLSLATYVEVSKDLPKLLATSATSRHVFGFFTVASSNRLVL